MDKVQLIAEIIGYVAVVATLIVNLTPSPKDDAFMSKVWGWLHSIFKLFPTIGINPNTRILEEKLKEKK